MNTFDESMNDTNPCGNQREVFDLIEIAQSEVELAWNRFLQNHLQPSRLFRLASGVDVPTADDQRHLEACHSCRSAYAGYLAPCDPLPKSTSVGRNGDGRGARQKELWSEVSLDAAPLPSRQPPHINGQAGRGVPDVLRRHLHVEAPVVFGENELAFESWQFGRLLSNVGEASFPASCLINVIVGSAKTFLIGRVDHRHLMLVCFGRAMHRCGVRLAAELEGDGFRQPHVVLAHDFYSPTIVCSPKEFVNADVIVLVDVVHSGSTLDRLMSLCIGKGPRRVRGLALVDQSERQSLRAEWFSLWSEPKEERTPLDLFIAGATDAELQQLRRFDPNEEVATAMNSRGSRTTLDVRSTRFFIDAVLLRHIHETGALKCDYRIGKKRYPYVVNVLDLVKKSVAARTFVMTRLATELADLAGRNAALAFHAGRRMRAGHLAQIMGSELGLPVLAIGSPGNTFSLTDQQLRELAGYDVVVIVDAAMRTGETIAAVTRAIDDKWLRKHTRFVALCVVDALSDTSQSALAMELGIEIRTLFKLPLAPPTEEVRHWTRRQRLKIFEQIATSGTFANVAHVLAGYCAPSHGRHSRVAKRDIESTEALIQRAVERVQGQPRSAETIQSACDESKAHLIRHLSVNEVVHDRNTQELLLGVMFNSVKPSLKESAAFALALARNYEWMTLDWLRCNRAFLSSTCNSWKSIVVVECEMKLADRLTELARFGEAARQFRDQHLRRDKEAVPTDEQLTLPHINVERQPAKRKNDAAERHFLLLERLDTLIAAAE